MGIFLAEETITNYRRPQSTLFRPGDLVLTVDLEMYGAETGVVWVQDGEAGSTIMASIGPWPSKNTVTLDKVSTFVRYID